MVTRCDLEGDRIRLRQDDQEYEQQLAVTMVAQGFLAFGRERLISDIFLAPAQFAADLPERFDGGTLGANAAIAMEMLTKRVFPPVLSQAIKTPTDWLEIGLARCMPKKPVQRRAKEVGVALDPPPKPGEVDGGGAHLFVWQSAELAKLFAVCICFCSSAD